MYMPFVLISITFIIIKSFLQNQYAGYVVKEEKVYSYTGKNVTDLSSITVPVRVESKLHLQSMT